MSCFKGFSSFNEDPVPCPNPGSNHDSSGRGQSKGTGAGDEEDCHGVDKGLTDMVAVRGRRLSVTLGEGGRERGRRA